MKYQYKLSILIFTLILSLKGTSQTYDFQNFHIEKGLTQSSVNSIFQDSQGYLWLGTAGGGIYKFDGINFIQYTEKEGIAGNVVTGVTEDLEGNIWFTSTWGGVTKYNGRKFETYSKLDDIPISNQNIFTDFSGKIWIGSEKGLTTFFKNKITNYKLDKHPYFGSSINFVTQDSKKNIWIGSDKGIVIINDKDTLYITSENGLPDNHINDIIEDNEGNYWLGTRNSGLFKLLKGSLSKKSNYEFKPILTENINITGLLQDRDKKIWFSTQENGIYCIDKNNKITNINKNSGLKTNRINKIFKDRSGNLWLGTNEAGLIKMLNSAFTYFDNTPGLNQIVNSTLEDNSGNFWFSTRNEGVYKYDGEKSTQYTTQHGLGSNTVLASLKDQDGNLWFATEKGLTRYQKGVFKNFTTKDGLPTNRIRSLLLDNEGNIWIGTNGKGLVKYDYASFKVFSSENSDLSHDFIHSLFQDSKENIWIGTGSGINKYVKGTISNHVNSTGICNSYIGSITEDKFGNIWFGTDRCVVKYDGVDFKSLTVEDGLASSIVRLLHWSSRGNLWIGTNNGLDKITFNSYGQINEVKHYGLIEGFKGLECNSQAIYEDLSNNLWIGTIKGCIKYDPSADRENVYEPYIHINSVKLSFEKVNWFNYVKEVSEWNNLPKDLKLAYNENHLTFDFSAINLTHPEYIKYSFKLDGFDEKWFSNTKKNSTTYSNLPPGEYTFMVKARNKDHVWNQTPAKFSFSIQPPFWKTWWFYLLLFLFLIYSIYKISSYREKKQLIISRELEKMVKNRTFLIEQQRDEKEVLLKEIHHRVKNNMQVISSLLNIQSSYMKDPKTLALFKEARNRIRSMGLIHEKLYQSNDLMHINFQDYIMVLTNDIIETYAIDCDIFLDVKIDPIKFEIDALIPLGLLLNEILSNALKYAFVGKKKGRIKIHLIYSEVNELYTLTVGDNGKGMDHNALETETESLGIELIKIFVEQIDGTITLAHDEGTEYTIKFKNRT